MDNSFYTSREFDDFAAFADSFRLWNVRMTQLHCGKTFNNIRQLSLKEANLNHLTFNGHKTTVGDPPRGRTFAFWSGENSELIWRRKSISQNSVMIYPRGAEHEVMTKGENINVHTITFPETAWNGSFADEEVDIYSNKLSSCEVVSLTKHDMFRLRQSFHSYFKAIDEKPEILDDSSFRTKVEEHILLEVQRALFRVAETHLSHPSRKTPLKVWERLEIILEKASDSLLPVNELCSAVGVSERSLRRLFHDRYGTSPKIFLNRTRLNNVRRELKNSSCKESNITDVANNHGFWHMGQFAADYRKLFGELPYQTARANV